MPDLTLSGQVERACKTFADRFVAEDASGELIYFSSFLSALHAFCEQLADHGVQPGQTVSIRVDDPVALVLLRLATMRLGAYAATFEPEIADQTGGIHVDHWIGTDTGPITTIRIGAHWIRPPGRLIGIEGNGGFVVASSGTTGRPKLRLRSDHGLLWYAERSIRLRGAVEGPCFLGYHPRSSPFANNVLRALLCGQRILWPRPTPEQSLSHIAQAGATELYLSPYNFGQILAAAEAARMPPSISKIVVGGGPIPAAMAARAKAVMGCEVFNTYGSAETGSLAQVRVTEGLEAGVLGLPHPDVETRFRGEDGKDRSPQDGGELLVRIQGRVPFLDFPGLRPLSDPDGWIATGDIARRLDDGQLKLEGRISELLNIGGNKIAPQVFEEQALRFPGVESAAAFRAPMHGGHDHVGLVVRGAGPIDLHALGAVLAAHFGVACQFEIAQISEIPATAAGKVDRGALTGMFLASRQPEQSADKKT